MTAFHRTLALIFLFAASISHAGNDSIVARVNGDAISSDELRSRLHEYQTNLKGDPSPEAQEFRERVLNELIEEKILQVEARTRKVEVTAEELTRALKEVEKDYAGESFAKTLAEKKMSYSRWRERMRLKLLLDKVTLAITKDVPPPVEAAVVAYYAGHSEEFHHREQIHLQQIVVKTAEDAKRVEEELKKGRPFEELARAHSFTPEGMQGGDLGWVERGVMPTALEEVFVKLPVGKTSAIVQTDYGFHLVRVLERKAEHQDALSEVHAQIVRDLTRNERDQRFSAWKRDILSKAKIERNHALLDQID
ncbi:MAG: peptidylprolyl isomerase [Pseudomonadota bacterium]